MTIQSNTQITPETVGMLKAGDWLRVERGHALLRCGDLVQFERPSNTGGISNCIVIIHPNADPGFGYKPTRFTYIGPDLGDGWIGWSGGQNPVPGMMVETEYRDGNGETHMFSDELRWDHPCNDDDIIAFRPAASSPSAVGVGEPWYGDRDPQEVDQAYGEYDGTSCELCGRERVMIGGATGKRICEKCGTYQATEAENLNEWSALSDLHTIKCWLDGLATAPDLTDVVADGGVSIGDCYQQEAREFAGRLDRAILALRTPTPAPSAGDATVDWQVVGPKLVEALEWYGEKARLARLIHSEGDAGRNALAADGGKRALATLADASGVKVTIKLAAATPGGE